MTRTTTACALALLAVAGCASNQKVKPDSTTQGLTGVTNPILVEKPAPAFSNPVKKVLNGMGELAWIDMEIIVKKDGTVEPGKVLGVEPLNNPAAKQFVEETKAYLRNWRFAPALVHQSPVDVVFEIRLWPDGEWGVVYPTLPIKPCSKSKSGICGVDGIGLTDK